MIMEVLMMIMMIMQVVMIITELMMMEVMRMIKEVLMIDVMMTESIMMTVEAMVMETRIYDDIIIIIDNLCIALFSDVPKLTALYNILQYFLSFTNIIHIIMTTNNV